MKNKVIIVDDNPFRRAIIAEWVENAGVAVKNLMLCTGLSAAEATWSANADKTAMVVTTPFSAFDGAAQELITHIRQDQPQMPVTVIVPGSSPGDRLKWPAVPAVKVFDALLLRNPSSSEAHNFRRQIQQACQIRPDSQPGL